MKRLTGMLMPAVAALILASRPADGGEYITLDPLGSTSVSATGVSGGNVVGQYRTSGETTYGFLYNGTSYVTLDPAGSTFVDPTGIPGNNVVGYDILSNGNAAGFLFNITSQTYTTFGPPGAISTSPTGISGGNADPATGNIYGFVYQQADPEPSSLVLISIGVIVSAGYQGRRQPSAR